MKYYLAQTTTRHDDYVYGEQFAVEAENERQAEKRAKRYLLEMYADPEEDAFDKDNRLDLFYRIIEFEGVQEITRKDYDVLRKYLFALNSSSVFNVL